MNGRMLWSMLSLRHQLFIHSLMYKTEYFLLFPMWNQRKHFASLQCVAVGASPSNVQWRTENIYVLCSWFIKPDFELRDSGWEETEPVAAAPPVRRWLGEEREKKGSRGLFVMGRSDAEITDNGACKIKLFKLCKSKDLQIWNNVTNIVTDGLGRVCGERS